MDDKNPKYFEANYPEKNREEKYPVLGDEKMESECQMSEESINIRNKELAKRYNLHNPYVREEI